MSYIGFCLKRYSHIKNWYLLLWIIKIDLVFVKTDPQFWISDIGIGIKKWNCPCLVCFTFLLCTCLLYFTLVSFLWSTKISLIGEEVEKVFYFLFFYTKLLKCKIGSNIIMQTKSINLSPFFEDKFGLISFDLCTSWK